MILSFPWHTLLTPRPESSYVALLGVVRLSDLRILPTFIRFGVQIERQLKRSPGAVGYRTGADIPQPVFYHLSAWTSAEAIQEFIGTAPHGPAAEQLAGRLGPTSFRYWSVYGSQLPMHFRRELHRLTKE